MSKALVHGGQLTTLAKRYGIPAQQWLDLSTGIAPEGYPVGALAAQIWRSLPEPSAALLEAASHYYATPHLLPIAGSQSLIQWLPTLCQQQGYANSAVWLPLVGYKEHQKAWQQAGYSCCFYQHIDQLKAVAARDIVLLINPNNPSAALTELPESLKLLQQLSAKSALLIVDEAFMDCTPEHSLMTQLPLDNLLILRSIGKFFGLAGIRLGFVAAAPHWLDFIAQHFGPWCINGPAQAIATLALNDQHWQQQQRQRLHQLSHALQKLLGDTFGVQPVGTLLFQTIHTSKAQLLFDALCQHAVYVRLCDEKDALRFGIPTPAGLARLSAVFAEPSIQTVLTHQT